MLSSYFVSPTDIHGWKIDNIVVAQNNNVDLSTLHFTLETYNHDMIMIAATLSLSHPSDSMGF